MAAALRHTRRQAQQTYDRRTSNERKQLAISLASEFVEQGLEAVTARQSDSGHCSTLKVGDFVGLVEEGSSDRRPKVLIGRIRSFVDEDQANLLWYRHESQNKYFFQFDTNPWVESVDALVPANVTSLKRTPGLCKLNTSLKSIHKAVHSKSKTIS